jgi:hypothetical protein
MTKTVADTSAQVDAISETWPMIDALLGKTGAMRKAGKLLLPQWPNESDDSYKVRLNNSVLHPVFSRTVQIMAAKPFIQDMKMEPSLPSSLELIEKDCDLFCTGLREFFADRFAECLSHGITGVLADYSGKGGKTVAEEKQAGARPYLCHYAPQSILGWRVENNQLSQIRLMESVTEPDGQWGEITFNQVRVLTIGAWQIYRKNEKDEWVLFDEGTTSLDVIPFTFLYGNKKGFGVGESPLVDLAYQNVEHWQSCSDQQSILHVARVPILFARMFGNKEITIGAGCATSSEAEGADLRYVEHSGAAIAAGSEAIKQLEERMLHAGAELLTKREGKTTATQVLSENEANRSTLQNIVVEFEEGIEQCLKFLALWVKDSYEPEVELYKDFSVGATDSDMDYIIQACGLTILSKEKVIDEMVRRNMISEAEPPTQTFLPIPEKVKKTSINSSQAA